MSFPIRARLTAWYVVLLAAILAGLSAFLLLRLRSDLVAGVDRSLDARAAQISLGYQGGGEGEFQDITDATLIRLPQSEHGAQILSARGQVVETSGDPVAEAPMLDQATLNRVLDGQRVRVSAPLGADRERFRLLAVPAPKRPRSEVLVVATSLDDVDGSIHRLLVLLLTAGPAVLAVAAAVGWWLARKALLPVARMTQQAATIGIERLDERIAVPAVEDELARLARTLNAMLDRLERGVERTRRFVADASHELRTPLAVMRSELEVSLRSDDLSPAAREVVESSAQEVERMGRLVENLLTLARLDERRLQLHRVPLDLRELAAAVAAELEPLAAGKGVAVMVGGLEAVVEADRERLHQAVSNLMDNAIKYTGRGGEVRVSAWRDGAEAGIAVIDTGRGVDPESLPRIFDRFFRSDPARSRAEGGAGLGLAISREIVQAHGGRIWARSEVGSGSTFSLALPAGPRSRSSSAAEVPATH
ncbi:MAG: heavy metal sensor histidine kinase [Actinomycetota bacterium]|nr:heavy metal sensor histidine kinase [Actinomycetota bacterium]